ncbi:hypothetical protein ACIQUF_19815 [Pseudomonas sp. NPDC090233]|uniref:hypothetical protein n=1 Tax=Pseudomonas sp. NPDC090233 TaxID=3364479 RepID=UPI00383A6535
MLKIVPDPPLNSLEDSLAIISEYLVCAHTITQQLVFLNAQQPMQAMGLAVLHEVEAARGLVEQTLARVQTRH